MNKIYDEILSYDQLIKDYLPYEDYENYKINIYYSNFNDFKEDSDKIKEITSSSDNKGDIVDVIDIVDAIIYDNSNIIFDNYMDKNVNIFTHIFKTHFNESYLAK